MQFTCPNCFQEANDPDVTSLGTGTAAVCDKCGQHAALPVLTLDRFNGMDRAVRFVAAWVNLDRLKRQVLEEWTPS